MVGCWGICPCWDCIRRDMEEAARRVREAFEAAARWLAHLIEQAKAAFQAAFNALSDFANRVKNAIADFANKVMNELKKFGDAVMRALAEVACGIVIAGCMVACAGATAVAFVVDLAMDVAKALVGLVLRILEKLFGWLANALGSMGLTVSGEFGTGRNIFSMAFTRSTPDGGVKSTGFTIDFGTATFGSICSALFNMLKCDIMAIYSATLGKIPGMPQVHC